jgi:hypothetical protein
MQFAIGVTVLECSFVKHSHGPLGVNASVEFTAHPAQKFKKNKNTMGAA